jgi:hypothetical protein
MPRTRPTKRPNRSHPKGKLQAVGGQRPAELAPESSDRPEPFLEPCLPGPAHTKDRRQFQAAGLDGAPKVMVPAASVALRSGAIAQSTLPGHEGPEPLNSCAACSRRAEASSRSGFPDALAGFFPEGAAH